MGNNESLNYFMRLLQERHSELKKSNDALFTVLVKDDKKSKDEACQNNLDAANNLSLSLAEPDKPEWLKTTIQWCDWYAKNTQRDDANNYLFDNLSPIRNDLMQHAWSITTKQEDADFHFDEM